MCSSSAAPCNQLRVLRGGNALRVFLKKTIRGDYKVEAAWPLPLTNLKLERQIDNYG
jgi:hypothetical protein